MTNKTISSFEERIKILVSELLTLKERSHNSLYDPFNSLKRLYSDFEDIIKYVEGADQNTIFTSVDEIKSWLENASTIIKEFRDLTAKMESLNKELNEFDVLIKTQKNLDYLNINQKKNELLDKNIEYSRLYNLQKSKSDKVLEDYGRFNEVIRGLIKIFEDSAKGKRKARILRIEQIVISTLFVLVKLIIAFGITFTADYIFKISFDIYFNKYMWLITGIIAYSLENIFMKKIIQMIENFIIWKFYDEILNELIQTVKNVIHSFENLKEIIDYKNI